ncbi:MAG: hypothetical protein HY391_05495, partial [Deltaproteobacteria bacterium]|nr:hypothetical protein [Deltaproteobacteria bacterium]
SLVLSSSSFFIPGANIIYLSDLSVNHAAEEAAEFLYACCSRVKQIPVDPMESFYTMIVWEALGFFGSKLINHKRPATPLREFMTQVKIFKGKRVSPLLRLKRLVAQGVIEVKEREKEFLETGKFRKNIAQKFIKNPQVRFRIASEVGYMLGEKLHGGMIAEIYTREMIRDLFYNPLTNAGEALDMYLKWVKELRDITPKYKSKKQYL